MSTECNPINKKIYIFEHHNEAIISWNEISKDTKIKPSLLTFDYHTDTHLALLNYTYHQRGITEYPKQITEVNNILSKQFDLYKMVRLLKNDEQIDFAIRSKIISHAYVISHDTTPFKIIKSLEMQQWEKENFNTLKILTGTQTPKPTKHTYCMPENKIIELGKEHFQELNISNDKDEADLAIDDKNLKFRIDMINQINQSIFGKNYNFLDNFILDIDLDYFNTYQSINPTNKNIFYLLIKKSKAITIAKESYFVERCKRENENINANFLLQRLLKHIKIALK